MERGETGANLPSHSTRLNLNREWGPTRWGRAYVAFDLGPLMIMYPVLAILKSSPAIGDFSVPTCAKSLARVAGRGLYSAAPPACAASRFRFLLRCDCRLACDVMEEATVGV